MGLILFHFFFFLNIRAQSSWTAYIFVENSFEMTVESHDEGDLQEIKNNRIIINARRFCWTIAKIHVQQRTRYGLRDKINIF